MVIEAPAYALLTIGFVFTFAFLWTFDKTFRATLGPALTKLAGIGFGGIRSIGAVHPFGFLNAVVEAVESYTARGLQASERGITYSINKVIDTGALLFGVPLAIALALYELAQFVAHQVTKVVTRVEVHSIVKPVKTTVRVVRETTVTAAKGVTARVHALEVRVTRLAHAIPHAIPSPFPRIGRIEKTVKAQTKRLSRIEKALAVGASAALVWTALRKLGLSWLRCSNVGKAGKAVCGMNPSLLESLLLDAALLTVAFNLEEFAKELQTVTGEAARLINNWAA